MNSSTSLGTRSNVGMAKPSPPVRQAGNIGHLLVIRGVYRRSLPSACAHVKYRCRCRVRHFGLVEPVEGKTLVDWATPKVEALLEVTEGPRVSRVRNEMQEHRCK